MSRTLATNSGSLDSLKPPSVSGAMLSQRSYMLWVSRCSVLTDGTIPPILAKNSSASRGVQWPIIISPSCSAGRVG